MTGGNHAQGGASEYLIIAALLEQGHKVAKPVVDDDGVDLIVNYRTTVQVKRTSFVNKYRHLMAHTSSRPGKTRDHVDLFIFHDARDTRSIADPFFIIPTHLLPPGDSICLTKKYGPYRGAWHLFNNPKKSGSFGGTHDPQLRLAA